LPIMGECFFFAGGRSGEFRRVLEPGMDNASFGGKERALFRGGIAEDRDHVVEFTAELGNLLGVLARYIHPCFGHDPCGAGIHLALLDAC